MADNGTQMKMSIKHVGRLGAMTIRIDEILCVGVAKGKHFNELKVASGFFFCSFLNGNGHCK